MLIIGIFVLVIAFALAFANGANDNAKGVATLIGSGVMRVKPAIIYAAIATAAGSVTAIWIGASLASKFKGKGMLAETVLLDPLFPLCVGVGAAATVLLATRVAMPISTTHAMVGSIIGIGVASGELFWGAVWSKFFFPLLVSPLIAVFAAGLFYLVMTAGRRLLGITAQTCVCVGETYHPVAVKADGAMIIERTGVELTAAQTEQCTQRYGEDKIGITAQKGLAGAHLLSAGAISFARGLNDTPKVAALMIGLSWLSHWSAILIVGVGIAVGGVLMVYRIAETMSQKITEMNEGQAFSANAVTAFLVIIASKWGVPVSTTHVSCGSLFGIGVATGRGHWKMIATILAAWVTTLPCAALIGAGAWLGLTTLIQG